MTIPGFSTRVLNPRVLIPRVLILAGLVLCSSALRADVIYSNFGANFSYAYQTGITVADTGSENSVAIAFTPLLDYLLSSIEVVATTRNPDLSNTLTLSIFADNDGIPGTSALEILSFSGQLPSFVTPPETPEASYLSLISSTNPELHAGTTYWLVMDGPAEESLIWDDNSIGTFGLLETNGTPGAWLTNPNPNANQTNGVFQIDGTLAGATGSSTPEPHSLFLMAGGLLAVVGISRRRA